jgi:hypothetical protein
MSCESFWHANNRGISRAHPSKWFEVGDNVEACGAKWRTVGGNGCPCVVTVTPRAPCFTLRHTSFLGVHPELLGVHSHDGKNLCRSVHSYH